MPREFRLDPLEPKDFRVGVVLPVYSETESVRQVVSWLREYLWDRLEEIVIVLSPRSSEQSRSICQTLAAADSRIRIHMQEINPGLGNAVREGYVRVKGNVILNIDSDGEMEIETVARMMDLMGNGKYGLVVASRWLPGGGFSRVQSPQVLTELGFQQVFRILFWTRLHDLTYGFKLMRAELARGIVWEGTLHEIACETTLKPVRLGVKVAETPSRWTARTQGVTKNTFLRNFRYVATAIKILVRGVSVI